MNDSELKREVIKNTVKYTSAQYGARVLGFIASIGMRRFLGPHSMGIWSLLLVVVGYSKYTSLGVNNALVFRVPFFLSKGDKKSVDEISDTVFSFSLIGSLIASFAIIIFTIIFCHNVSPVLKTGLFAISIFVVIERLYAFYIVSLRARNNFSAVSKAVLFDAVIFLILTITLVKYFKLYGLYATVCLTTIFNIFFIRKFAHYSVHLSFNFKRLVGIIKYGLPIFLSGFSNFFLRSIDRIMIAAMLGVSEVGYYSIALMARSQMVGFANNFASVTIPAMLGTYAKEEKIEHIRKFVTVSPNTISYLIAPVLGLIFFSIEPFVKLVLPQYIMGIVAAEVLLLDIFFRSCESQASQFLIALGKQSRILLPINIVTLIFNVFFNLFFIKVGWGITGVALGTALASTLNFMTLQFCAMRHFANAKSIIVYIIKFLIPLLYIITIIIILEIIMPNFNHYARAFCGVIAISLFSLPLYYYVNKKTSVLSIIFSLFRDKITKWKT